MLDARNARALMRLAPLRSEEHFFTTQGWRAVLNALELDQTQALVRLRSIAAPPRHAKAGSPETLSDEKKRVLDEMLRRMNKAICATAMLGMRACNVFVRWSDLPETTRIVVAECVVQTLRLLGYACVFNGLSDAMPFSVAWESRRGGRKDA